MLTKARLAILTTAIIVAMGVGSSPLWDTPTTPVVEVKVSAQVTPRILVPEGASFGTNEQVPVQKPDNFLRSVRNVLISEGGATYTNHPKDPGGPTKYGVTIHDVRRFIDQTATADRVKALTEREAIVIYRTQYWDALNGDALPKGVDYTIFDYGVNSGVARAGRVLRLTLGLPSNDWHVTPEVVARVLEEDPGELINAINNERQRFLQSLSTYPIFGRGWSNRVRSVRLNSLAMANPAIGADIGSASLVPRQGLHKAYEEGVQE